MPQRYYKYGVSEDKNSRFRRTMEVFFFFFFIYFSKIINELIRIHISMKQMLMEYLVKASLQFLMDMEEKKLQLFVKKWHLKYFDSMNFLILSSSFQLNHFIFFFTIKSPKCFIDLKNEFPDLSVPEVFDKTFQLLDAGLKKENIIYSGCTTIAAYLEVKNDEVAQDKKVIFFFLFSFSFFVCLFERFELPFHSFGILIISLVSSLHSQCRRCSSCSLVLFFSLIISF